MLVLHWVNNSNKTGGQISLHRSQQAIILPCVRFKIWHCCRRRDKQACNGFGSLLHCISLYRRSCCINKSVALREYWRMVGWMESHLPANSWPMRRLLKSWIHSSFRAVREGCGLFWGAWSPLVMYEEVMTPVFLHDLVWSGGMGGKHNSIIMIWVEWDLKGQNMYPHLLSGSNCILIYSLFSLSLSILVSDSSVSMTSSNFSRKYYHGAGQKGCHLLLFVRSGSHLLNHFVYPRSHKRLGLNWKKSLCVEGFYYNFVVLVWGGNT